MTKYVVYGLGISGISAAKFLAQDAEVIATDDNEAIMNQVKSKLESEDQIITKKIKFQKIQEINFDKNTVISFSPGIPLHFPKPHQILNICRNSKANLACDIEIFYRKNLKNNFIGITGTNGKSTTTALTGFIFKEIGLPSEIGGNIGVPCFNLPQNQQNFSYIFEASSYQLDLISQTHFNIAALLNITPDHLDHHGSMTNYIATKKHIFKNQKDGDFALIDVDNENSRKIFDELKNDLNFRANLIPISTNKIHNNGVSLIDGRLSCNINSSSISLDLKSEFLRGKHNDQNMAYAFAISYCELLKKINAKEVSAEKISQIIKAIQRFKGLRHRMQIVGKIANINFINDSKATNAESTENALKSYDNIFWILGGKAKDGGISTLKPYFKRIVKAFLIGEATEEFAKTLSENFVNFKKCDNLECNNNTREEFAFCKSCYVSDRERRHNDVPRYLE